MFIKYIRVIPILFFLSCGIPSFDYIGVAQIDSTNDSSFTFTIDLDSWPITNGFMLYSRYYIGSDSKINSFEDIEVTSNESISFLEDLGFTMVTLVSDSSDEYTEYFLSDKESFSVVYDTFSSNPVVLTNENGNEYYLKSNYINSTNETFPHEIGNYADDDGDGEDFLKSFEEDLAEGLVVDTTINIEFSIITTGISSGNGSLATLKSLPVYIDPLNIQIY